MCFDAVEDVPSRGGDENSGEQPISGVGGRCSTPHAKAHAYTHAYLVPCINPCACVPVSCRAGPPVCMPAGLARVVLAIVVFHPLWQQSPDPSQPAIPYGCSSTWASTLASPHSSLKTETRFLQRSRRGLPGLKFGRMALRVAADDTTTSLCHTDIDQISFVSPHLAIPAANGDANQHYTHHHIGSSAVNSWRCAYNASPSPSPRPPACARDSPDPPPLTENLLPAA